MKKEKPFETKEEDDADYDDDDDNDDDDECASNPAVKRVKTERMAA